MTPGRGRGLTAMDMYSVMCVRDTAAAVEWYAVFFGRPADEVIGEEHLWQVGGNAWLVVDDRSVRAARVGGSMITFGVTDFDDILARLAAHGVEHELAETYGNGVRHVEILDPDGNSLSLAQSP
jgi:catechol 2,3-dioxygenase-like lactoylglutathione lyase family enzyme